MSALRRAIVRQFAKPSGLAGRFVGWIMATRPSNQKRSAWTVDLVAPAAGECLLEIGCGPGYALSLAASRADGLRLVGLDHSPTMIAQATERLGQAAAGREWLLVEGGLERIREWPDRFDAIWSVNVVQFFPDLRAAFEDIRSALKPGGRVVTTFQPRNASPSREDAQRMAESVVAAIGASGFESVGTDWLELEPAPAVAVTGRRPR